MASPRSAVGFILHAATMDTAPMGLDRAVNPPGISDGSNINPDGCWNWWGYAYDKRYLFKDGVQLNAIWQMVERVAGLKN